MMDWKLFKARMKRLLKRRWCPKCHCIDIEEIYVSIPAVGDYITKAQQILSLSDRPAESFECIRCRYRWINPEFERYIAIKGCVKIK